MQISGNVKLIGIKRPHPGVKTVGSYKNTTINDTAHDGRVVEMPVGMAKLYDITDSHLRGGGYNGIRTFLLVIYKKLYRY